MSACTPGVAMRTASWAVMYFLGTQVLGPSFILFLGFVYIRLPSELLSHLVPGLVTLTHPVSMVACGQRHTMVVTVDNFVFGWGYNRERQVFSFC
jgi:hypothetical protein